MRCEEETAIAGRFGNPSRVSIKTSGLVHQAETEKQDVLGVVELARGGSIGGGDCTCCHCAIEIERVASTRLEELADHVVDGHAAHDEVVDTALVLAGNGTEATILEATEDVGNYTTGDHLLKGTVDGVHVVVRAH